MKITRVPTNFIIKELMPHRNVKHLFGRYFWDADFKKILKGDKCPSSL
jgi:hypothetical protein